MATSYVQARVTAKAGGAANVHRAEARRHFTIGLTVSGLVVLLVIMYLTTGRCAIVILAYGLEVRDLA